MKGHVYHTQAQRHIVKYVKRTFIGKKKENEKEERKKQ